MRITYPDGTFSDEADCVESCTGHLGKFPDCRTEALYNASLEWQPESTGSTEWNVWACIMHFPTGEYLASDTMGEAIWIPAGSYVLCTDDRGFVWIECGPADGRGAAEARFAAIEAEYNEWDLEENGDDGHWNYDDGPDVDHKDIEGKAVQP